MNRCVGSLQVETGLKQQSHQLPSQDRDQKFNNFPSTSCASGVNFFGGGKILQDGLPDMYERSYGVHLEVLHGLTKKTHTEFLQIYSLVAPGFFSHFFVARFFFWDSSSQEYSMKLQHFYSLLAQQATSAEHSSGWSLKRFEGPIFRKESDNSIRKCWGSRNHLYIMI